MQIKQFIEKAIEGGFDNAVAREHIEDLNDNKVLTSHDYYWLFLRPEAWQAVGKVEGWESTSDAFDSIAYSKKVPLHNEQWKMGMHRMIDALCEGKSVDQFLEML